ncbi:hypothetical protein Ciccas_009312, partial [Cichlidogyrus casuarinus]
MNAWRVEEVDRLIEFRFTSPAQLVDRNAYNKGGAVSFSNGKKTLRLRASGGAVEEQ